MFFDFYLTACLKVNGYILNKYHWLSYLLLLSFS